MSHEIIAISQKELDSIFENQADMKSIGKSYRMHTVWRLTTLRNLSHWSDQLWYDLWYISFKLENELISVEFVLKFYKKWYFFLLLCHVCRKSPKPIFYKAWKAQGIMLHHNLKIIWCSNWQISIFSAPTPPIKKIRTHYFLQF